MPGEIRTPPRSPAMLRPPTPLEGQFKNAEMCDDI